MTFASVPSYDLLTPDGQSQLVAEAYGVFWWQDSAPPPVEYYWADRQPPEWFRKKRYDLFYPKAEKVWWARSAEGKWDVIENEKLIEEGGRGPEIEVPRIIFR